MKKLLFLAGLTFLFSCAKDEKIVENTGEISDSVIVVQDSAASNGTEIPAQINIETFGFPPEVSGCSCYFSKNKEDFQDEKFVYIDDYGNNAYLKIEGKTIKIPMKEGDFDPENFNKSIKNDEFTITIKGKKIKEFEEVMMFEGTMTVENKNGEKTVTPIYGECGC